MLHYRRYVVAPTKTSITRFFGPLRLLSVPLCQLLLHNYGGGGNDDGEVPTRVVVPEVCAQCPRIDNPTIISSVSRDLYQII